MPDPLQFLQGFGLTNGEIFGGYVLINVNTTHHAIKRYHEYSYKITLQFRNESNGTPYRLLESLRSKLAGNRTINSSYGNPYLCNIDPPIESNFVGDINNITVMLLGHSYRQY